MNRPTDQLLSAEQLATRALAKWGITAHADNDSGNTWLVIGRDQSTEDFPHMLTEPYIVLYLHNDAHEITVTRPPLQDDRWHVIAGDPTGAERTLTTQPADQLSECVTVIAEWVTDPLPTAGAVLLATLAEHNITVHTGSPGMSYAVPLDPATPAPDVRTRPHLSVADRNTFVEHAPGDHTGWTVFLHDESGDPVGDPLYITGDGGLVDCTADSKATAEFITRFIKETRD